MRWCLFAAATLLASADPAAAQQANVWDPVREVVDPLPGPIVISLAEDAAGFLWVGTSSGLGRYDGSGVATFTADLGDEGLPAGPVRDILVTEDDEVWVAIAGAGVHRLDAARTGFRVLRDPTVPEGPGSIPDGEYLFEDSRGRIWVGGNESRLWIFDLPNGRVHRPEIATSDLEPQLDHRISSFAEDASGGVWLGTLAGRIYYVEAGTLDVVARDIPGLSGEVRPTIRDVVVDAEGRVWFGTTGRGVLVYDTIAGATSALASGSPPGSRLANDDVMALLPEGDSVVWVSTYGGGVHRVDVRTLDVSRIPDPEGERRKTAMVRGRDGSLWVGSWGRGVTAYRAPLPGIRRIRAMDGSGLRGPDVTSIAPSREGGYWISEYDGGLYRFDPEAGRLRLSDAQPVDVLGASARLFRVHEARDGTVRVATWGVGLQELRPGETAFRTVGADWLAGGTITAIHEDEAGRIWLGTRDGFGVIEVDGGEIRPVTLAFGPEASRRPWIRDIVGAPAGHLLVSTADGLLHLDPATLEGRWILHKSGSDLLGTTSRLTAHATAAVFAPDGSLWVGFDQGGAYRLVWDGPLVTTPAVTVTHRLVDELPHPAVKALAVEPSGRLWISTRGGLAGFDPDRSSVRAFFEVDGLAGDDGSSGGLFFADGLLIRLSPTGLSMIETRRLPAMPRPPAVAVTGVRTIDADGIDTDYFPGSRVEVPWRRATLLVDVSTLEVGAPYAPRYEYRLAEGDPWRPLGRQATVALGDNEPGTYDLQFRARTAEGALTDPSPVLRVVVVPPWWRTPWARAFFFLVLAGAVVGWSRVRISRLAAQNARLAREIDRRTRAERERDQFEAQFRRAQRLEAVGELTGGVAHDFNNILTVLQGNLDLIALEHDADDETGVLARECLHAADQASRLTQQLLSFSRKQVLAPESVDLRELFDHLGLLLKAAVGTTYELHMEVVGDRSGIEVDRGHLESALLNLVLNARDAQPGGGRIEIQAQRVRLAPEEVARIDPEFERPDPDGSGPIEFVRISVRDRGEGMPEHVRERVFEPFYTTKEPGKGTGLGLSMVYGFVRQSGGVIEIRSTVGEGTEIALLLPPTAPAVPDFVRIGSP